jgi:hypothetical protein
MVLGLERFAQGLRLPLFFAAGLLVSGLGIVAVNFVGTLTPKQQLLKVFSEADRDRRFDIQATPKRDLFTECALAQMALDRHESTGADIFTNRFSRPKGHPCESLRFFLDGGVATNIEENSRYFYGSRHVLSILANWISVQSIRNGCLLLSVLSPLLLWGAFWARSRSDFVRISPVMLSFLVGFGYQGDNLGYAPAVVIPFLLLAVVVLSRNHWLDFGKRVFIYTVIAAVTTYFDILTGGLPIILCVTLLVNHLLYNSSESSAAGGRHWVRDVVVVTLLFPATVLFLSAARLWIASTLVPVNAFAEFYTTLLYRTSSTVSGDDLVTRRLVWETLWAARAMSFFHSTVAANAYYLLCGASWLLVLGSVVRHGMKGVSPRYWREYCVLAWVALIMVSWFTLFPNHTYVHAHTMVRLTIVPAAIGLMALAYMADRTLLGRAICWVSASCVPVCGLLVLLFPSRSNMVSFAKSPPISRSCHILTEPPLDSAIAMPLELNYGNRVRLLGITIEHTTPDTVRLSYYWQSISDWGAADNTFIHFTDAKDNILFQNDHPLCDGQPYSNVAGKYFKETFLIAPPERARASPEILFKIGVYDPRTAASGLRIRASAPGVKLIGNDTAALVDVTSLR